VKGKIISQDRPEVLDDINEKLVGIEKMGHNFFGPNPVKGMFHPLSGNAAWLISIGALAY